MSSSEEDPEEDPDALRPDLVMDAPDAPEDDEDPLPDVDSPEDIIPAPEAESTEDSGPAGAADSDDSSAQQTTP